MTMQLRWGNRFFSWYVRLSFLIAMVK